LNELGIRRREKGKKGERRPIDGPEKKERNHRRKEDEKKRCAHSLSLTQPLNEKEEKKEEAKAFSSM